MKSISYCSLFSIRNEAHCMIPTDKQSLSLYASRGFPIFVRDMRCTLLSPIFSMKRDPHHPLFSVKNGTHHCTILHGFSCEARSIPYFSLFSSRNEIYYYKISHRFLCEERFNPYHPLFLVRNQIEPILSQ